MKARITIEGVLEVSGENETELYALSKWLEHEGPLQIVDQGFCKNLKKDELKVLRNDHGDFDKEN